jgi:hypothetical protein
MQIHSALIIDEAHQLQVVCYEFVDFALKFVSRKTDVSVEREQKRKGIRWYFIFTARISFKIN